MSQVIIMPKLGLTMTHGRITRWLKKEGDPVREGEVVVEIETDKISSEVESPVDGIVEKILAEEGEEKEITTPLCTIREQGESAGEVEEKAEVKPDAKAGEESKAQAEPERKPAQGQEPITASALSAPSGIRIFITPIARKLARENGLDYTKLAGTGPEGRIVKKDILSLLESGERIKATPLARKIARDHGIDYSTVKGTGPDGRIVKADILASIETMQNAQEHPADVTVGNEVVKRVPLAGIRRIVAERLTQSKHDIPHVYFKINVDAENILELKNKAAESVRNRTGRKLSLNDIIIRATAVALGEFPDFNASLQGEEIIYYRNVNIGIAVNSDRGLVVPVIRAANEKSLSEVCRSTGELIEKARTGKLGMEEMTGGTFTISNLGAYHIDEFCAIINPPESAILAVGRAAETPVVRDGQVVIRPVMTLTISVDHRVIDGAQAAQFMKRLKEILEDPYLMLI